jgi:hypothetical protein
MTHDYKRTGTTTVFKSVAELEAATKAWHTEHNSKPRPLKWTANADAILAKNTRGRSALELTVEVPSK